MNEAVLTLDNDKKLVEFGFRKKFYFFIKRIFDILFSLTSLVILSPVLLAISILIKIDSKGKVIYKHKRIGKDGQPFYIYKFRSMKIDADNELSNLLKSKQYKNEWLKYQKIVNDPRITKIGKVIRKTSLDELPQLINVLKGEMSIIGPRPLVEGELDLHNGNHKLYESVQPGISGWWAVNGRSSLSYSERLKLEYYYIENCSILLDIKCFIKTIFTIIKREGAK